MWEDDSTQIQSQCLPIPGRDVESSGITAFSDLTKQDEYILDKYKHVIKERICQEKDFDFPDDFQFIPTSVAKQAESSDNYYFRFDLPHDVVIIKIIPNRHINDLSKHITLRREQSSSPKNLADELIL